MYMVSSVHIRAPDPDLPKSVKREGLRHRHATFFIRVAVSIIMLVCL
jgi:hypothetical protein